MGTVKFSMGTNLSRIFKLGEKLVEAGAGDFVVSQITLEDAFLELTKDQKEEHDLDAEDEKKKASGGLSCFSCLAGGSKSKTVKRDPLMERLRRERELSPITEGRVTPNHPMEMA